MSDRCAKCGCEAGKMPNPSFHVCPCHSTPPAPPGLVEVPITECPACHYFDGEHSRKCWHLAALQQARKDERARIVKAVRELAADARQEADHLSSDAEDMARRKQDAEALEYAADFIETLEDTP